MAQPETREAKLLRLLATVVDANYGADYHDIGNGDGITPEEAEEISLECRRYWNGKYGAFPQFFPS